MEMMLTAGILVFVITGMLLVYVNTVILNELYRNNFLAYNALQAKMEELKGKTFDQLCPTGSCPTGGVTSGTIFPLNGFAANANGRIEIHLVTPSIKQVSTNACFMSRRRLIGQSLANCYTSPVQLTTYVFGQ